MKYYRNFKKRCVYTKIRPICDWHLCDNLRLFPSASVDNRDCITFHNLYFSKWPAADCFFCLNKGKEMSLDLLYHYTDWAICSVTRESLFDSLQEQVIFLF